MVLLNSEVNAFSLFTDRHLQINPWGEVAYLENHWGKRKFRKKTFAVSIVTHWFPVRLENYHST